MIELDPRDAVRALALVYDGERLLPPDHSCDDLYGAGVVRLGRDFTDEYRTEFTTEGEAAVKRLLEGLNPAQRNPAQRITHGRHCTCSACAREDWTNADLAPCGMHGARCPALYRPWGRAGDYPPIGY